MGIHRPTPPRSFSTPRPNTTSQKPTSQAEPGRPPTGCAQLPLPTTTHDTTQAAATQLNSEIERAITANRQPTSLERIIQKEPPNGPTRSPVSRASGDKLLIYLRNTGISFVHRYRYLNPLGSRASFSLMGCLSSLPSSRNLFATMTHTTDADLIHASRRLVAVNAVEYSSLLCHWGQGALLSLLLQRPYHENFLESKECQLHHPRLPRTSRSNIGHA